VPPVAKEAVDDQAISAGVSADTAGAIEAAIEAAGSQVGTPAGAEVRFLAPHHARRNAPRPRT
jgi:hypothetical protein